MRSTSKSLISFASAAVLMFLAICTNAATLNVPSQYATIQAAIDAAATGDTIVVAAGTYRESLSWVSKDLVLQGAGQALSIVDPSAANGGPGGRCLYTSGLQPASRIDGFTLQKGSAVDGGGMYNDTFCSPTVTNCTFSGNTSTSNGGGLYNHYSANPAVSNCTFSGNSAVRGGGIRCNSYSSPTVTDCTFTNNTSVNGGGAMYNYSTTQIVVNCILWGNQATSGNGAIFDDTGSISTVSYSDVQDLNNSMPDANGNFAADPLFVNALGDDFHLTFASPCHNAGNNAVVTSPPFLMDPTNTFLIDLDGNPRTFGGTVDLGAYEYQNLPPSVSAGGSRTVTASHTGNPANDTATLTLTGSATDPQNFPLTVTWTDGANNPLGNTASLTLTRQPGTYPFTLTASDPSGLAASDTATFTVKPAPNQAPTANGQSVSLNQDTPTAITLTATDPDGDTLTYAVSNPTQGTLSGTAPNLTYAPSPGYVGTDTFTFTVTDPYAAISNTATVSITVKDTTPPVITLNGANPMTLNQGSTFTDPGATAVDNVDGSVAVSVSGSVNTAVPATYILNYTATDSAGNRATATRTVNVVAAAPKVTVKLTAIVQLLRVVGIVVTLNNGGSTTVTNVKINSASLIGVNASLIVPNYGFTLGAGKSADAALAFYPLQKGLKGTLSISGSYSGGTFSFSQAVTIP